MIAKISISTVVAVVLFAAYGVAFASSEKVEMCHVTGSEKNPYVVIGVSSKSFDAHVAQGDFLLPESGECTDGGGGPFPA